MKINNCCARRRGLLSGVSVMALALVGSFFVSVAHSQDEQWMSADEVTALEYAGPDKVKQGEAAGEVSVMGFRAEDVAPLSSAATATATAEDDVYLSVKVNGEGRDEMVPFRQTGDGGFILRADDLRKIGLLPTKKATDRKGWVDLGALETIQYRYNSRDGSIEFTTTDESAIAPYSVSLSPWAASQQLRPGVYEDDDLKPQSDLAAVLNYSVYADTGREKFSDIFDFQGVSATLDGRVSGWFGTFYTAELLSHQEGNGSSRNESTRLDSYWTYSDDKRMLTYQAGDMITRSLPWTRSVRMGGFQLRRNFNLRENLLTTPMPEMSGSAAVPSSVDLYINNAKRMTSNVPSGPFSLTDMPVISGTNTARLVVRDAMGRETVQEMAFYSNSDMLAKGLLDFSVEAGMPRRYYGTRSGDYSGKFMASGTIRYGLTNKATVEGHMEAGSSFFNGGAGGIVTLGDIGSLALAGSASTYKSETGQQLYAGLELRRWGVSLNARTQRTYGKYNDMASVVDRDINRNRETNRDDDLLWDPSTGEYLGPSRYRRGYYSSYDSRPPKAVNQISLSSNLRFDPTTLNVSYTEVDNWKSEDSRYLSMSASRNFGKRVFGYATAFVDLKDSNAYSVFAGVSILLDDKYTASSNVTTDHHGTSMTNELRRQVGLDTGDYGWSLRGKEGKQTQRTAEGQYNAKVATFAASVEQIDDRNQWRATGSAEGAFVFADGAVTPSRRVSDSFAVVNAGVGGVGVKVNNSHYDKTWPNGRLVVPNLRSYSTSKVQLDMDDMPVDALVDTTEVSVKPAYNSGVVAKFGGSASGNYVYVSLLDQNGEPIETGSFAEVVGTDLSFDVAYDGTGIVPLDGVKLPAQIMVQRPNDEFCQAILTSDSKSGISAGMQSLSCVPVSGQVKKK